MEALRKSGKSLKDLTEAQLDAIHENLDDGESHLWEAHEEFSKKITQLEEAGLSQGPEYADLIKKLVDLEDALDDIELDDDVLYREEERREAIAWRKDVAPPLLVVGIGVLGSALLVVVSWALDS